MDAYKTDVQTLQVIQVAMEFAMDYVSIIKIYFIVPKSLTMNTIHS